MPQFRIEMLIDSQAEFEITNKISIPFYKIMVYYKNILKIKLTLKKNKKKIKQCVVVSKIGITAGLVSIREVSALFSSHG